jgi:hypothetical protein
MSFESTYSQFVNELKETFPEFTSELDLLKAKPIEENRKTFLSVWRTHTSDVAKQNNQIFASGIEIVSGVNMTAKLWGELSANSQSAIWKYLSSLLLLGAAESTEGWDLSGFQHDLEEMLKKLKETGFGEGLPGLGNMGEMFEKLSKMAESFGFKDFGGMHEKFKIPERMFKGHLAKIVQELVKEFKPEDFGITADMVESNDPAKVFEILQEIFTKKPELLASAAQKIGKKIQAKFQNGEIRREDIIQEAEELMKEVSENEMFSSLFGSIGEMMKNSEKSSGNEGSARRREVQERLRKKKADKDAKNKTGGQKESADQTQANVVVHADAAANASAVAAADAAAASLLLEESSRPSPSQSQTKPKKK